MRIAFDPNYLVFFANNGLSSRPAETVLTFFNSYHLLVDFPSRFFSFPSLSHFGHGTFHYHSNIIRPSTVTSAIFPVYSEKAHSLTSSRRYFSLLVGTLSFGRVHPSRASQQSIAKTAPVNSTRGATLHSSRKSSPDSTRTHLVQLWSKVTATTNLLSSFNQLW